MNNQELSTKWQLKFDQCLELEFSNPDYFKVHHILVPTYSLQIGAYAEHVRTEVVQLLKQFLIKPEELPSASVIFSINQKIKSFKEEGGGLQSHHIDLICTEKSILNVRTDTAEHYCNDIVEWSRWLVSKVDKNF